MENFQGDLTDIFRASGELASVPQSHDHNNIGLNISSNWEFQSDLNLTSSSSSSQFGDPFCNITDPLLHLHHHQPPACYSSDHNILSTSSSTSVVQNQTSTLISGANSIVNNSKIVEDEMNKGPSCDIFSRIQISHHNRSPADSPVPVVAATSSSSSSPARAFKASPMVSIDVMNLNSSETCLIDNINTRPLQISSPRNLGIKRRKSQAKKVVCIPAPAAANSRPSGEVVPSDLWAWRKYGQKPIKGSPFPRGYYRCSSSKGCSARKQVERSRTDPNMLVITYTSEHNHPWPTQRNALAGSTRSQPPKPNKSALLPHHLNNKAKEEEIDQDHSTLLSPDQDDLAMPCATAPPVLVKEENVEDFDKNNMEINIDDQFHHQNSYRPTLPDSNQSEDFFAELGEIEADPLHLLFGHPDPDHKHSKGLDPFTLFDWSGSDHHENNHNNNNNNISIGHGNKGL